jgi:hypothetical protein
VVGEDDVDDDAGHLLDRPDVAVGTAVVSHSSPCSPSSLS